MQGFVLSRASSEFVSLLYYNSTENEDGSATLSPVEIESKASVGILQPKDIERLEKAGIIVRAGITIAIPSAQTVDQPDTVIYDNKNFRVVNWSAKNENNNISVVATCEEMTIQGDDREYAGFPEGQ